MNCRILSLILLLYIQGFLTLDNFPVMCHKQSICAITGQDVTLTCFYSNINITTVFWFSQKQRNNWRENDEPEDLTLDSDYSGRVNQLITNNQSQLTISDVRERDSGEYQLMFIMKDEVKHLSSVTVSLTVTVLQVRMIPEDTLQSYRVKLICDSSCNLTSEISYYWHENGERLVYETFNYIVVPYSGNTNRYSCTIANLKYLSSSFCVSNSNCWNVTYTSRRVCALVGSTVDIHSTYSHPTEYTIEKTYWYYIHGGFRDLRKELKFAGRVEYVGNTLRIKVVKMSDSGEYQFRIFTNTSDGRFFGSPGVILTVTDTQVKSSPNPVLEGEKVILSCSTKCTLNNSYTYIWYKNGQQVTDGFTLFNKLYLDSISSEEIQQYSCAVGGNTDLIIHVRLKIICFSVTEFLSVFSSEIMSSSVFGYYIVFLLVFLPQFLIIGALWMWFFVSMNKIKSKNKTDDKHKETPVLHMSIRSTGVMSQLS